MPFEPNASCVTQLHSWVVELTADSDTQCKQRVKSPADLTMTKMKKNRKRKTEKRKNGKRNRHYLKYVVQDRYQCELK